MRVLVTGGAGLVGSTLCERLLDQGASVFCVDNLSLGSRRHLESCLKRSDFKFEPWDVSRENWHKPLEGQKFDLVAHLAANSDISLGHKNPEMDMERTFLTTFHTLQAVRALKIPNLLFSSTSAVYGAIPVFPTPELTSGLHPVSIYGAGKLASEAFISAFVENYGLSAWVFRFGNVVGKRLTHGVIYDFIRKLKANPQALSVLGNGRQDKTYIDVDDCVSGMLHALEKKAAGQKHHERFQIFNLSCPGSTQVKTIAEETARIVTNGKTQIVYESSEIGWVGDVPKTSLSVEKILALGWKPALGSTEAVFKAIREHYEWIQS